MDQVEADRHLIHEFKAPRPIEFQRTPRRGSASNGKRSHAGIIINMELDSAAAPITLVQNWNPTARK
ncbi:MAG: hypothetical protein HYR60_19145 [Acidobacteria bacterium]|nr:hypothetical protein [Acidobacteriota bacterium]